ncbi:unnamed protein product [Cylindrotheca closterium]|uniref:Wax synthase domain-containing protein n=1 Tax=Cylindrotheca closterium TaxID=2856 RepID=A0AAD2CKX2_9STRA|nr:unnamed protein product [Cylindrotheca closterium]
MRFATGCLVPIVSIFRATEAAHGFAPEHSTKSEKDYMVYYASLLIISRDEKGDYIKCTWGKVARHGCNFLGFLLILGMYKSIIMLHEDLVVFGPPINSRSEWNSLKRFVTWELYANNMVHAILFQLYLTTYVEGLTLLWTAISGCQVDEVMKNPMFESRSPSDFWSKRWNLLIHTVLKGGVYKPVRKNGSIALACISVFLASGLFHEFLLAVTFFEGVFIPAYGYTLAFFFWQAALIVGEISFGRSKFFQILGKSLPSTARTVLVISLGLPLAHMFSEPYARSNFFQSGLQGVPTVLAFSD